jgi:uncharacterized membrane protein YjgN (DUF898 family)
MDNLLTYIGRAKDLYKIYMKIFFLSVITLGMYRFWGKTRLRSYMWSHFHVDNDPLVYHGNAIELLKGFFKAFPFCIVIIVLLEVPYMEIPTSILIIWILNFAIYSHYKYLASRTSWRGIRFYLNQSSINYANKSFLLTLKNIVTLGIIAPKIILERSQMLYENLQYGDMKFTLNVDVEDIKKIHWKTYLWAVPTLFMSRLYFLFYVSVYVINNLSIGPIKFRFTSTFKQYAWLEISNMLINLCTAYMARPYTLNRKMIFMAKHIVVEGDIKNLIASAHNQSLDGEDGSGDLLGIGAI